MIVIYFSGTGNTKHLSELLADRIACNAVSIEDSAVLDGITQSERIIFAFPVYSSDMPEIVRNFINNHSDLWQNKQVFIVTTCGMINGFSIRSATDLFRRYGAEVLGGEFIKMPDNIGDHLLITTLMPQRRNPKVLRRADEKVLKLSAQINRGEYPQHGLSGKLPPESSEKVSSSLRPKIDKKKCNHCGICERHCPSPQKCTLCYRCYNLCPQQAITILGDKVRIQYLHEDFRHAS